MCGWMAERGLRMIRGPNNNLLIYPSIAVKYNFTCCFEWVSNLVIYLNGGKWDEGVIEWGTVEVIWA
jgi:hypothetical protein